MEYVIGFLIGAVTVLTAVVSVTMRRSASRPAGALEKTTSDRDSTATSKPSEPGDKKQEKADTKTASEPAREPHSEPSAKVVPDQPQLRRRLFKIADDLEDFFDQAARPADLLDDKLFSKGTRVLSSELFTTKDLLAYGRGSNSTIACMALEALSRRDDDDEIVDEILSSINNVGYWVSFFALRALDRRVPGSILGRVLTRVDETWSNRYQQEILRGFFETRVEKEGRISLPKIESLSDDQFDFLDPFLSGLSESHPEAARIREEITNWRKGFIDVDSLGSITEIWTPSKSAQQGLVEHEGLVKAVSQLKNSLEKTPRRSLLLIGEPGVGKTALLRSLATRLHGEGWVIFQAGAVELMAGQVFYGQIEERLKTLLEKIGGGRKVLWVIPDFDRLLWAGRHRYSPSGILETLLPAIQSGEIVVAGEIQPSAYQILVRRIPFIRAAVDTFHIQPPSDEATLELAESWLATQGNPPLDPPDLLREGLQLSKQYLGNQAKPGSLLRLLQLTLSRITTVLPPEKLCVTMESLLETLAQLTGLPHSILDDRLELDVGSLRELFEERVLGQPEAVTCLVDRVAMIKAGLTDPTRPQGVFFFSGPTGTGKTEIAKTLAEFLFGSSERLIRLDMSEFQSSDSLSRLVGDTSSAQESSALVDQIRKQPFSVILLDEFEKASEPIWNHFLQIFDDGRLTDTQGNTADFRHSTIIITSNLGGDITGAGMGFSKNGGKKLTENVEKAIAQVFRREFINRIDRIVVFRPLDRSVMRKILHKELQLVLQRRGLRNRSWAVEWEESAIDFLLDRGFDATLGARPLKRAIDRYLLSPLALTIVNHQVPDGDQFLFVRSDGQRIIVEFIDPDAPSDATDLATVETRPDELGLAHIALQARGRHRELEYLREHYEKLKAAVVDDGDWKSKKTEYLNRISTPGFWSQGDRFSILGEAEYMDRIEAGLKTAGSLIERLHRNASRDGKKPLPRDMLRRLAQRIYLLEAACAALEEGQPRDAFLRIRCTGESGGHVDFAKKVTGMYRNWAKKRGMSLSVLDESTGPSPHEYEAVLAISGYAAFRILAPEAGLHVLEEPGTGTESMQRYRARVKVAPQPAVRLISASVAARRNSRTKVVPSGHRPVSMNARWDEGFTKTF